MIIYLLTVSVDTLYFRVYNSLEKKGGKIITYIRKESMLAKRSHYILVVNVFFFLEINYVNILGFLSTIFSILYFTLLSISRKTKLHIINSLILR